MEAVEALSSCAPDMEDQVRLQHDVPSGLLGGRVPSLVQPAVPNCIHPSFVRAQQPRDIQHPRPHLHTHHTGQGHHQEPNACTHGVYVCPPCRKPLPEPAYYRSMLYRYSATDTRLLSAPGISSLGNKGVSTSCLGQSFRNCHCIEDFSSSSIKGVAIRTIGRE
jgi:hypothetical protein